ncbi:hypothetical protein GCM10023205_83930 [Yinghuangia aomiensis]|uniref:Uncharacterized protein n=1 Tax=Yinghuangia aomiensis TaxID=676205 RepID=A0ABP9IJ58_9ACTN
MTGHGNGDRAQEDLLRRALTNAMDGATGPEPGMPDLLGPAMAEGTRIRRRRRATLLVALSTAAVLVGGGLTGGFVYLGQDSGKTDRVPVGGQPPGRPSGEALAALLESYFAPKGWSVNPAPMEVRTDAQGGKTVKVLVRDAERRTGVLELSVARMRQPLDPGQSLSTECGMLRKLDPAGPESGAHVPTLCEFVATKDERTSAWDLMLKRTSDADPARYGTVRVGPSAEIVRVWMLADRQSASPSPNSLYAESAALTRISADKDLTDVINAIPDTPVTPMDGDKPSKHPSAATT